MTPVLQWFQLNFGARNFRGRRPGTSVLRMLLRLTAVKCVPYVKQVSSTSGKQERCKATYLFQVTPCPPCGSILFRAKPICNKRMHRLVSIRVFYILGGGDTLHKEKKGKCIFSLATCLFLALIACVRETKKVSDFVALIFCKL